MFSVFGRTGPHKKGAHRPRNVGRQRDIFWLVGASFWRDNLWPVNIIRLTNSESRISNQVIAAKMHAYSCNAEFVVSFSTLMSNIYVMAYTFTKQGLLWFESHYINMFRW